MAKWDLKSHSSVMGAAKWLRKGSEAQVVLILRAEDWAVDADPALLPQDVVNAVRDVLPPLYQAMLQARAKR